MANTGFLPVLLGSDQNVYGMARCFHEKYGISSMAIGKGRLPATADSRIVQVVKVEPNIEDDDIFVGFPKVGIYTLAMRASPTQLTPIGQGHLHHHDALCGIDKHLNTVLALGIGANYLCAAHTDNAV